ncbi:hypothetical protein KM043_003175 [Ampulex compressa]|nr:hypothetical protein KM043_003175 [Ampulex compressa]
MFPRDLNCLLILVLAFDATRGKLLNRPQYIYEGLIKSVHDYFNNTCIILFHGTEDPLWMEGLQEGDGLMALQKYLSAALQVRTSVMDFGMFRERATPEILEFENLDLQVGHSYYRIKRPLFVLLNDQAEVRDEFADVSSWIAMAYPTWLVFLEPTTALEDFFKDIHAPFNGKLMVARSNAEEERITEVYRIDEGERIRATEFGSWSPSSGLKSPRLSLYQRRNDLFGRNIRVVSVQDPPISVLKRDQDDAVIGIQGFFGEVIKLLEEGMNCT